MSIDPPGWRGLAADLIAADQATSQPIQQADMRAPTRSNADRDADSPKRRRRRNGETFASTNQLVGLWLPHEMAAELRTRAEHAGLSNSEFVREILRERFNGSR